VAHYTGSANGPSTIVLQPGHDHFGLGLLLVTQRVPR